MNTNSLPKPNATKKRSTTNQGPSSSGSSRVPSSSLPRKPPASSSSSLAVNQLIEYSKKFTQVNQLKLENELILEQLTFFQNLCEICKERNLANSVVSSSNNSSDFTKVPVSTNSLISNYFEFDIVVVPIESLTANNPSWSFVTDPADMIHVKARNISESFIFHHKFWYFAVNFGNEEFPGDKNKHTTMWNLESVLKPSDCIVFSDRFSLVDYKPRNVKISLIFNVNFQGQHYLRVFDVAEFSIDVLFLLNPAKIQSAVTINHGSNASSTLYRNSPPYFANSELLLNCNKEEQASMMKKLPKTTKFQLCVNSKLDNIFMELLFITSSCRGFIKDSVIHSEKRLIAGEEMQFYVGTEKIIMTRNPTGRKARYNNNPGLDDVDPTSATAACEGAAASIDSNNQQLQPDLIEIDDDDDEDNSTIYTYTFRCYCSSLLFNLKLSLLRKLLELDQLKVQAPNDTEYEKLFQIKLVLESRTEETTIELNNVLEYYLVIRNISEHICYSI